MLMSTPPEEAPREVAESSREQLQEYMDAQVKLAWLDEMVSAGVVRQRFLPPHAGGVPLPAPPRVDATIEAAAEPNLPVASTSAAPAAVPASHTPATGQQDLRMPNHPPSGQWLQGPLRDCARNGTDDGALARSLLDAGAATGDIDRTGKSALHWAATRGNTSVASALLDAGADGGVRDGAGKTPLHCAALAGHAPIVEALLDNCGRVLQNAFNGNAGTGTVPAGAPAAEAAAAVRAAGEPTDMDAARQAEYISFVDARNAYGSTALHRAAFNGRAGVVLALLRGGAGVNVVGNSGRTALHLACRNAHPGCIEILLNWGANEAAMAKDGTTAWSELAEAAEDRRPGDPKVAMSAYYLNKARGRRAWGRRGWLLMLKARRNHSGDQGMDKVDSEADVGDMTARAPECNTASPCGDVSSSVENCADSLQYHADDEKVGEVSRRDLAGAVSRLLDLGGDGCFRLVLNFL